MQQFYKKSITFAAFLRLWHNISYPNGVII